MKSNGNAVEEIPTVKDKRRFDDAGKAKQVIPQFDIEPLNKWVLIKKIFRGETTTETGVTLVAETRSARGQVVAVAEGIPLAVGDEVIFTNYPLSLKDTEDLLRDKDLFLVRFEEIYARLKPRCT